jgi:hypothetical protein
MVVKIYGVHHQPVGGNAAGEGLRFAGTSHSLLTVETWVKLQIMHILIDDANDV